MATVFPRRIYSLKGKARASQNSRTIGAYTRTPFFGTPEEEEKYQAFCLALEKDVGAKGVLERLIIGQVAWSLWLLPSVQRMIDQQMRMRAEGGCLAVLEEFMKKSEAVKLPVPGLCVGHASTGTDQEILSWEITEFDLHLVGADHSTDQSEKLTGQAGGVVEQQDKSRNDQSKRTHFDLKTKVTDPLERLQRNEADLIRKVRHWLGVLRDLRDK